MTAVVLTTRRVTESIAVAVYTRLSTHDVTQLLAEYGRGAPTRVEGILAGSRHTNYLVEVGAEKLFLRVNERTTAADLAYECALVEFLVGAGFPTPALASSHVANFDGKPVTLFRFAAGAPKEASDLGECDGTAIGAALAHFHVASHRFNAHRANPFSADRVAATCEQIHVTCGGEIHDVAARLRDEVRAIRGALDHLPPATIHGDLFPDNILWDGGRITAVLDFEMASDGAAAYDIAVALVACTVAGGEFRWPQARALVAAYHRVSPLDATERSALYPLARFVAARFAVSRITDFELRPAAAGERIHKDYRDFMACLERLVEMGGDGFRERLFP